MWHNKFNNQFPFERVNSFGNKDLFKNYESGYDLGIPI